jgi:hypothetical protein
MKKRYRKKTCKFDKGAYNKNMGPRTLEHLKISAIIPACNEAKNILKVLGALKAGMAASRGIWEPSAGFVGWLMRRYSVRKRKEDGYS